MGYARPGAGRTRRRGEAEASRGKAEATRSETEASRGEAEASRRKAEGQRQARGQPKQGATRGEQGGLKAEARPKARPRLAEGKPNQGQPKISLCAPCAPPSARLCAAGSLVHTHTPSLSLSSLLSLSHPVFPLSLSLSLSLSLPSSGLWNASVSSPSPPGNGDLLSSGETYFQNTQTSRALGYAPKSVRQKPMFQGVRAVRNPSKEKCL